MINTTHNTMEPNNNYVTRFISHVQHNWLRYFIVIMVLSLVVSAIIRAITPTPVEEQPVEVTPISKGVTDAPNSVTVTFANRNVELPETLPLFQATTTPQNTAELAASLAQEMSIPKDPSPHLQNVWTNYETKEQITYQQHSGQVTYNTFKDTPAEIETNTAPFNTELAIQSAENFIQELADFPELSAQTSEIYYLEDEHTTETGSTAELIVIPLTFKLNNYPVYFSGARETYVRVQINKAYEVKKAEFFPPPPPPQEIGSKTIKTLDAASAEITNGQATVISAGSSTGAFDVTALESLRITNTTLEYRFDPQNRTYIPYFRFEAEGVEADQSDQRGPTVLTLILPAIPTTPTSPTQEQL